MSKSKSNSFIKRIVDTAMTVLLLWLMAYRVTGEAAHEWIGMGMAPVSFARRMHLSMSHWAFVLMGLYLFLRNGMPDYLFFRVPFAFLDYDKAGWLVFLENILILSFWALIGTWVFYICRKHISRERGYKE